MLTINTIRYGTDEFVMTKKELTYSITPLDCTGMSSVTGFTLTSSVPSGTDVRAAFQIGGTWYKLVGPGAATLSALPTQTITTDSVLAEGNTVAELAAITGIASFVGQSVNVAIALMAPGDATAMPYLGIVVNGVANTATTTKTETSSPITLADTAVEVVGLSASISATGGASAAVTVSLQQNGTWSNYMPLTQAQRQLATAIKFQAAYSVATIGTGSAVVNRVTATYRTNNAAVSGDTAEVVTVTEDFDGVGMRFGRITVVHQALQDAELEAYISMRTTPKVRERIAIATGTGNRQTVTLGVGGVADPYINHNTLRIWYGSQEIFDFDFNTELSQASLTPPDGVTAFASYSYGWEPETWVQMTKGSTQSYADPNTDSTEFTYTLPNTDAAKGVSAIKVLLKKPGGTVVAAALGTATGKTQMFVLPHAAKLATVQVAASAGAASWSYDESSRILTAVGTQGAVLSVTYDWIAETPAVDAFVAAWSE